MQKDDDLYPRDKPVIESDPVVFTAEIARVGMNNNNVYTKAVLEKVVKDFERRKCVLGCLEPSSNSLRLEKISHKIVKIWLTEDRLMAEIMILNTPCGNILKNMSSPWEQGIDTGYRFGITGVGTIKDGVVDKYELKSVDLHKN